MEADLKPEVESLACNFTCFYLLQAGKKKFLINLTGQGMSFLLACGDQVLQADLLFQEISSCEGFLPSMDGEKMPHSQGYMGDRITDL